MSTTYKVIYRQRLRQGFSHESVRESLAKLLKLSESQVEKLLGMQAIIRKDVDLETAKQYQKALYKRGMLTTITPPPPEPKEDVAPIALEPIVAAPEATTPPPTEPIRATDEAYEESRTVPFRFSGQGGEYFKIWIVNIVLTILTLGIYSAWAKVRNKQYFYGNTTLDGASFEYTAQPITILKGRLVAFVFVAAYYALTSLAPLHYQLYIYAAFGLAFVIIFPWVVVKGLQFNARHSQYRNIAFGFSGSYWESFKAFILWPLAGLLFFFLPFSWHRKARFFVNNSHYGTEQFEFSASLGEYYSIFWRLILIGLIMVVIGIAALVAPWLPILNVFVYLLIFAYFMVQTTNLMYSSSLLKTYGFDARFELRSYAWLMATNTLGIVLTLGFFTPWAKVRTARYKAQHISLIATESLNNFHAGQTQKINSVGEGLADAHSLFDIDVGI